MNLMKNSLKLTAVSSLLYLCACGGSTNHLTTVSDYQNLNIAKKDSVAYAISGEKFGERTKFDFKHYQDIKTQQDARIYKEIISDNGTLINSRYGYSSQVFPLYNFYQAGNLKNALIYNGFLHSLDIKSNAGNDTGLVKSLGFRGQEETSQILLDNGETSATISVVGPILSTITTDDGKPKFEEIQALNNRIIAEILENKSTAENDAKRVIQFQQEQREKYAKTLTADSNKKPVKKEGETSQKIADDIVKLFRTKSYFASEKLAKTVNSPYMNSTADFLQAYVEENQYLKDLSAHNAVSWDNVRISLNNVNNNVYDKESFKNIVGAVQTPPSEKYKVVYVLVASDIAPSKQVLYVKKNYKDLGLTGLAFSISSLSPNENSVSSVSVNGEAISKIASPQAYIAKNYIDHYDTTLLKQVAITVATALSKKAADSAMSSTVGSLGNFATSSAGKVADTLALPNTDGWQTMPANVYATRVVLPVNANQIELNVGNTSKVIKLNGKDASFIYARADADHLQSYLSK